MVAVPGPFAVARPVLEIVAADVLLELQVTEPVRFWVDPLLKVPVAVNCWVLPVMRESEVGVTEMETRVGPVTVSVVEPLTAPEVA